MPQYGSGGSGWAALAAALQGIGQGFQTKRDLDDRDRERARQEAEDRHRVSAEQLARDQYERQLQMMQNQEERETARVFADMLKSAPAGNRVTGLIRNAPAQYRPGLEALAEHQPAQTIPARDPRVFNFPPSVVDEAVGTPAPGDVIGQALSAQPADAVQQSPLPPPTQVPEQWNATGTAATKIAAAKEARFRQAAAAKEAVDQQKMELAQRRAILEEQKLQLRGETDRTRLAQGWATVAQGERRLLEDEAENERRDRRATAELEALVGHRAETNIIRREAAQQPTIQFSLPGLVGNRFQPPPAAPPRPLTDPDTLGQPRR